MWRHTPSSTELIIGAPRSQQRRAQLQPRIQLPGCARLHKTPPLDRLIRRHVTPPPALPLSPYTTLFRSILRTARRRQIRPAAPTPHRVVPEITRRASWLRACPRRPRTTWRRTPSSTESIIGAP